MWGLTHYGKKGDYNWDVVTGVSAGAINAAYMSAWAPRDTKEMTESLKLAWESLSTHQIWKLWPHELATAFLHEGLVDDRPALEFLTTQMGKFKKFKRRFSLAAANVGTGEYVEFT
jgi:predicted acylesterase/phospholipase RssA